jgi:hypothetical protein
LLKSKVQWEQKTKSGKAAAIKHATDTKYENRTLEVAVMKLLQDWSFYRASRYYETLWSTFEENTVKGRAMS